ncbi:hypothetical protein SDC9_119253 [bioreactor metagenome]|uniref:Uncharacterized protein n=1 Tax=bioreactor metagenome TaxID=1076179 RepID=A0A645C3C9_9ZZZZ
MHHGDPVAHGERLLLVVGNVNEGDVQLFLQTLEFQLHLLAQLEVQRAQGFVQQKHLRAVDERPGDCHPLLLPAGQLGGIALFKAPQLNHGQHLAYPLPDLRLGHPLHFQAIGHVVEHCHMGKEGVALKHCVHVALIGLLIRNILALHQNGALAGLLEARDHAQGGGFSAAGGAQQGQKLTGVNLQRKRLDHMVFPIALIDVFQFYNRPVFQTRSSLFPIRVLWFPCPPSGCGQRPQCCG